MNVLPGLGEERFLLVGNSKALEQVRELVRRAAPTTVSVLITGESGVGKETVARAIHHQSQRADKPFVAVNCDAIPGELIETELFGPEPGVSTGAAGARKGKLREANKGTLFLDEVADMSVAAQARLLRFLEHPEAERLSPNVSGQLDVRVMAATARNLAACVRDGSFNRDFLRRLSVVTIDVPALRERLEDIEALTAFFLAEYGRQYNRVLSLAPASLAVLRTHDWPGNVRELRNSVERAMVLARGNPVEPDELRSLLSGDTPARQDTSAAALERIRFETMQRALTQGSGRRRRRHRHSLSHRLRRWFERLPRRTTATLIVSLLLLLLAVLLVSLYGC